MSGFHAGSAAVLRCVALPHAQRRWCNSSHRCIPWVSSASHAERLRRSCIVQAWSGADPCSGLSLPPLPSPRVPRLWPRSRAAILFGLCVALCCCFSDWLADSLPLGERACTALHPVRRRFPRCSRDVVILSGLAMTGEITAIHDRATAGRMRSAHVFRAWRCSPMGGCVSRFWVRTLQRRRFAMTRGRGRRISTA